MEITINYFIKSALVLLVLYLFYYWVLRNQINFSFNRLYLLLAPVVSMLLPLLKWPAALAPENAVAEVLQTIQLSEVVVTAYRPASSSAQAMSVLNSALVLQLIYGAGFLMILFKFGKQLWQMSKVKANALPVQTTEAGVQVYQLRGSHPTFAFGNAIFLSQHQNELAPDDQNKVLSHELAHVRLRHSWDVVYYELLSAILWFNPLVWLLKQELRDTHEFQADANVLKSCDTREYSSLLSQEALLSMGLPIGSYFQKPQVLKRLQMVQQHGHKSGWVRQLLVLPLLCGLLFLFSTHELDAKNALSDAFAAVTNDDTVVLPEEKPAQPAVTPAIEARAEKPSNTMETKQPAEKKAEPAPGIVTDTEQPKIAPGKDEELIAEIIEEKPYAYVEQMPRFKGGETEMLKYLAKNIRYPKASQEAGVEGLVVLSFIVEKDGSLGEVQVVKPLDDATDAEATRVVKSMNGSWTPGSQNGRIVRVRYTMPVRFTIK